MAKLFSDQFYQILDFLNPYFYKFGFTPNILTGFSILFTLLSGYTFYLDYRVLTVIFVVLNYFFDCADGYFARKYNMESEFGDKLDHISDALGFVLFIYLFYKKNKNLLFKLIPLGILFFLINSNDIGCKLKKKKNKSNNITSTINYTKDLCIINNDKFIYFFNTATNMIIICFIILYYK